MKVKDPYWGKWWRAAAVRAVKTVAQTNEFCTLAKDGTAIAADSYVPGQSWLVMERVTPNVVKVVFR